MLHKFNNKVLSSVFLAKRIISYFKKNCKSNVGGGGIQFLQLVVYSYK